MWGRGPPPSPCAPITGGCTAHCQHPPLDAVKSMATVKLIWVLGGGKPLVRMGRWREDPPLPPHLPGPHGRCAPTHSSHSWNPTGATATTAWMGASRLTRPGCSPGMCGRTPRRRTAVSPMGTAGSAGRGPRTTPRAHPALTVPEFRYFFFFIFFRGFTTCRRQRMWGTAARSTQRCTPGAVTPVGDPWGGGAGPKGAERGWLQWGYSTHLHAPSSPHRR